MKGFYAKKSLEAKKILKEYRIEDTEAFKPGADVTLEVLKDKNLSILDLKQLEKVLQVS